MFPENKLLTEIAEIYDSPFYLYDQEILQNTYQALRFALPDPIEIFYSIKANPNLVICRELNQLVSGAEVCSFVELHTALRAGFKPENIIFVGPAKTNQEIEACITHNIYAIICESFNEFNRISDYAKKHNKRVNIAIRINPNFIAKSAPLKMGGAASQFGIDEDLFFNHLSLFLNAPYVQVIGIHVYSGSRILDAIAIVENTLSIFKLLEKIIKISNKIFSFVDIGGGLGVAYYQQEKNLDLTVLKQFIDPVVACFVQKYPNTRIVLESGRFLVATCGFFISQIIDKKQSKGEWFLVTDGGTNCHMAAIGIGSLIKHNFPISLSANKTKNAPLINYQITGPLCTPNDLIGKNVLLSNPEIGDFLILHNSGAYGPTASPTLFLSHGFPSEVLIKDKKKYLIRNKQNLKDFFDKQCMLLFS